jgi:leucyl-tRNA synthetase
MFTAPPEATLEWNDDAVEGSYRFLRRIWNFGAKHQSALKVQTAKGISLPDGASLDTAGKALRLEIHTVLKQVDYDYQRMQYNTVVSGAMKMLNALEGFDVAKAGKGADLALAECYSILLRCVYPVAPHLCHAVWEQAGYAVAQGDLLDAPWPKVDEAALVREEIELMLQINGKLRGSILVGAKLSREEIEQVALQSEWVQKAAGGASAKKVIVVPGRLVNVVL